MSPRDVTPDDELHPREAVLAFAADSAAGRLDGLGWVELDLDPDAAPYRVVEAGPDAGGARRYRQMPMTRFLPRVHVEAAAEAHAAGVPTAIAALHLIFARPEWFLLAQDLLLSPLSPVPAALALVVEPYGVPAELHEGKPERLARLAALLPRWYPWRGSLTRGLEVLAACDRGEIAEQALAPDPSRPEVFVVHGSSWWADRPPSAGELVVRGGVLTVSGGAAPVVEDVPLRFEAGGGPALAALGRLMPAWAVPRPYAAEGS